MRFKNYVIIFILLIIVYLNIFSPFYYIKDILFYPVHAINNKLELSNEYKDIIIDSLKEDIEELEKLNNISLSITDYDLVNATVISRNISYWFNTLTINKGSVDGINVDMAVIDSNGLIGRISNVTKNTSVVKLITTSDTKNKISAVINKLNVYGIINGYDSKNNLLNMIITDDIKIEKNSIVETTGMGGVFPRGILIGKVFDIIKKEDDVTNVVRVIPSSDIKGARYVSVIKRKEISTS